MIRLSSLILLASALATHAQGPIGIFTSHQDVGTILHPGNTRYDPATHAYTLTGSGENMWAGRDDFQFAFTKVSGDVSLSADITFTSTSGNPHRKAVLMIRQSLDPTSPSVDVARHGDGLTSLQFRDAIAADTHEVESSVSAPQRVRILKRGDYIYAFVSGRDGVLRPAGASTRLHLDGPFYIGIGVCAHDKDASVTAVFSNVTLTQLPPATGKTVLYSVLETTTIASTDRKVAYLAPAHFEAPNWSRDGSHFLFNQDGKIYSLPIDALQPALVSTAPQLQCNNDHGFSPDNHSIAISDQTVPGGSSIYMLPSQGGTPRRVTTLQPSYWHGWSPDGKTLTFTGQRNGNFDIYTIPVTGGDETRLTSAKGIDDGPEYSPDGQFIYFNSERSGLMQIWRMHTDGSQQERILTEDANDWFPHISPDGQWMVFLSYAPSVTGHPAEKDVQLKLMFLADKQVHTLARLFGGQGTINVPSWSPDSKHVAFVSYELIPDTDLVTQ
jgi:TolB protein